MRIKRITQWGAVAIVGCCSMPIVPTDVSAQECNSGPALGFSIALAERVVMPGLHATVNYGRVSLAAEHMRDLADGANQRSASAIVATVHTSADGESSLCAKAGFRYGRQRNATRADVFRTNTVYEIGASGATVVYKTDAWEVEGGGSLELWFSNYLLKDPRIGEDIRTSDPAAGASVFIMGRRKSTAVFARVVYGLGSSVLVAYNLVGIGLYF